MFRDQAIIMTGGSGHLGQLMVASLIRAGASVTVIDRNPPRTSSRFVEQDLSTPQGIEAAAKALGGQACDRLINLAGIQYFGPFPDQPPAHLMATYMVNLVAPARLTQAVLPAMRARGGGHIVNIGSVFGSINFAHFASYSSSKAGLKGLSQALRRELAGSGIDVSYLAPRAIKTSLNSAKVTEFAALTRMNMDEPEVIASRLVTAIAARRKDVFFGFPESLFVRINALAPGAIDSALAANDRKAAALFPVHQRLHDAS